MTLKKKIISVLKRKKLSLAIAESCTGGLLSSSITSISGSSKVFTLGLITYSNNAKIKILRVPKITILKYGAVSFETVREMLSGLCDQAESKTLTIAISGVAGPSGSESKPVGLVFIGVKISSNNNEIITKHNFGNIERKIIQQKSVHEALKMSLDILKNVKEIIP